MNLSLYTPNKHKYNNAMIKSGNRDRERGVVSGWMVAAICLIVWLVVMIGLSIWLYISYADLKNNREEEISAEVAKAEKKEADKKEADFAEREKQPNRQFVGPIDYGRLSFMYPKTWSAYVNKDATSGGTYEAYLNPVTVPPVGTIDQQFALRVTIQEEAYEKVLSGYDQLVKKGDLKSTPVSANGVNGTRLDGNFTKNIRGSAVIFKIRDKTATLRTDGGETFKTDFDQLITTIKFD